MTACNLYLHNLKKLKIVKIEVKRNQDLTKKAVQVIGKIPIVWLTGKYQMKKSLLFGFLPTASSSGYFNIDMKSVTVGVLASLKTLNDSVFLDQFEVGFHWKDSSMKFDSQWRGLDKISDLLLNKMDIGDVILRKKRIKIIEELEGYARGLFNCILHDFYEGPSQCMVKWWISQGFEYPWEYPTCE